jgi:hypothetical protein
MIQSFNDTFAAFVFVDDELRMHLEQENVKEEMFFVYPPRFFRQLFFCGGV